MFDISIVADIMFGQKEIFTSYFDTRGATFGHLANRSIMLNRFIVEMKYRERERERTRFTSIDLWINLNLFYITLGLVVFFHKQGCSFP